MVLSVGIICSSGELCRCRSVRGENSGGGRERAVRNSRGSNFGEALFQNRYVFDASAGGAGHPK